MSTTVAGSSSSSKSNVSLVRRKRVWGLEDRSRETWKSLYFNKKSFLARPLGAAPLSTPVGSRRLYISSASSVNGGRIVTLMRASISTCSQWSQRPACMPTAVLVMVVVASKPQPRDSDWNRDSSTFGDSIWTVKIRLERSRFDLEKKDLNRDKSAACWPTQSAMHESSQRFGLGSSLMSLLRRTFGENFTECWPFVKFFHFRYIWRHAYVALITVFLLNHF